jgi:hypothetical protein
VVVVVCMHRGGGSVCAVCMTGASAQTRIRPHYPTHTHARARAHTHPPRPPRPPHRTLREGGGGELLTVEATRFGRDFCGQLTWYARPAASPPAGEGAAPGAGGPSTLSTTCRSTTSHCSSAGGTSIRRETEIGKGCSLVFPVLTLIYEGWERRKDGGNGGDGHG